MQTLISSSLFIEIPINGCYFYCSPHFVSKINLANLEKVKLVLKFSQSREITGVSGYYVMFT